MPILGLLLILDDDTPTTLCRVTQQLTNETEVSWGKPNGAQLPVVLCEPAQAQVEPRIDRLREFSGVCEVAVVYANTEDIASVSDLECDERRGNSTWT
jgi:nitrate reductase NapAB chaperone NapD